MARWKQRRRRDVLDHDVSGYHPVSHISGKDCGHHTGRIALKPHVRELVLASLVLWCALAATHSVASDFTVVARAWVPQGTHAYQEWFRYESTVLVRGGQDPAYTARQHQRQICGSRGWRSGPPEHVVVLQQSGAQHGMPKWRYSALCYGLITPGLYR